MEKNRVFQYIQIDKIQKKAVLTLGLIIVKMYVENW